MEIFSRKNTMKPNNAIQRPNPQHHLPGDTKESNEQ